MPILHYATKNLTRLHRSRRPRELCEAVRLVKDPHEPCVRGLCVPQEPVRSCKIWFAPNKLAHHIPLHHVQFLRAFCCALRPDQQSAWIRKPRPLTPPIGENGELDIDVSRFQDAGANDEASAPSARTAELAEAGQKAMSCQISFAMRENALEWINPTDTWKQIPRRDGARYWDAEN